MNKKYRLTFDFFNTLEEANRFIKTLKGTNSKYLYNKYNKKTRALSWTSEDRTEQKIIVWYYI